MQVSCAAPKIDCRRKCRWVSAVYASVICFQSVVCCSKCHWFCFRLLIRSVAECQLSVQVSVVTSVGECQLSTQVSYAAPKIDCRHKCRWVSAVYASVICCESVDCRHQCHRVCFWLLLTKVTDCQLSAQVSVVTSVDECQLSTQASSAAKVLTVVASVTECAVDCLRQVLSKVSVSREMSWVYGQPSFGVLASSQFPLIVHSQSSYTVLKLLLQNQTI